MNRWLDANDPLRRQYGPELPPLARTHDEACRQAKISEDTLYSYTNKKNPRFKSGINNWSPLSLLMKFNMIWDFCPDMMHIIKTWFERLVVGVYSGERRPTLKKQPPIPLQADADEDEIKEHKAKTSKYRESRQEYEREILAHEMCVFTEAERKIVDERVKNLVGYPDWIKASLVSFIHNPNISVYIVIYAPNILLPVDDNHT